MSEIERQPELFQDLNAGIDRFQKRGRPFLKPLFSSWQLVLTAERMVILLISIIMLMVLSFAFGIERGKHSVYANLPKTPIVERPVTKTLAPASVKLGIKTQGQGKIPAQPLLRYTIQLSTYERLEYAQKEVNELKTRGFEASIAKSGKYYSVCVGVFSVRSNAEITLSKLKKIRNDCYIRRM